MEQLRKDPEKRLSAQSSYLNTEHNEMLQLLQKANFLKVYEVTHLLMERLLDPRERELLFSKQMSFHSQLTFNPELTGFL